MSRILAERQESRKNREQHRRDRLKGALDRLALVTPQEYAIHKTDPRASGHHTARDGGMRDTRVDIIESAILYIDSLRHTLQTYSEESGGQGK